MSSQIVPYSDPDSQFQVFNFNGIPVRGKLNENGEPEIIASDVCDAIGIGNVSQAVTRLDDDEKGVTTVYTPGGTQTAVTVTESGLYSLVLTSRKAQAKAFKRWITHEVLPAIRKSGMYIVPNAQPDNLDVAEYMIAEIRAQRRQLAEIQAKQAQQAIQIEDIHEELLDRDYFTILQWCTKQRIRHTPALRSMWGKEAAAQSRANNVEIKDTTEGLYTVGRYHKLILQDVCVPKPRTNGQLSLMGDGK